MRYIIMGKYPGCEKEEIDEFDTMKEAESMLKEYQIAYHGELKLWIVRRK